MKGRLEFSKMVCLRFLYRKVPLCVRSCGAGVCAQYLHFACCIPVRPYTAHLTDDGDQRYVRVHVLIDRPFLLTALCSVSVSFLSLFLPLSLPAVPSNVCVMCTYVPTYAHVLASSVVSDDSPPFVAGEKIFTRPHWCCARSCGCFANTGLHPARGRYAQQQRYRWWCSTMISTSWPGVSALPLS